MNRPAHRPLPLLTLPALAVALSVAWAVAVASCASDGTGPAFRADGFTVHAGWGRLVLRNESAATIHYVALERNTAAVVDLNPDPEAWPALEPGGEAIIPYPELLGWEAGDTHALIFWWTAGVHRDPVVVRLL